MKIGIFGGTFNPVHFGHLRAAEEVAQTFLNKVVFIPTNITSNKKMPEINPEKRMEMINIAIKNHKKFEASDIEIKRGGFSYSYDTIVQLEKIYPLDELYFIAGMDTYFDMRNWKNAGEIFDKINFIVVNRSNKKSDLKNLIKLIDFLPDKLKEGIRIDYAENRLITDKNRFIYFFKITRLDISSTDIRNNFKNNISNLFLLPNEVINYIINNKLY
ncbi:MAG: nicotinate-nucleotide adenylyltransferase [Deltaproteobacteria bacterium]|jgi:nicotinate-nucleotide adenylyltransferase|nr:nicotinate-nucleotide adenylyltransferase [Deltaproteobacteria bacterium]